MGGRAVAIVSLITGIALELGIHALSGRREAWDSGEYWTIGLPCVLVASAGIGYCSRNRAWIWTLLIIPGQVTTMMARSGEIGTLWPLAAALSAILSAPFVVAAFVGSRFRRTR
jgi:NAD/NADP transhydrogenase beta subunit